MGRGGWSYLRSFFLMTGQLSITKRHVPVLKPACLAARLLRPGRAGGDGKPSGQAGRAPVTRCAGLRSSSMSFSAVRPLMVAGRHVISSFPVLTVLLTVLPPQRVQNQRPCFTSMLCAGWILSGITFPNAWHGDLNAVIRLARRPGRMHRVQTHPTLRRSSAWF